MRRIINDKVQNKGHQSNNLRRPYLQTGKELNILK